MMLRVPGKGSDLHYITVSVNEIDVEQCGFTYFNTTFMTQSESIQALQETSSIKYACLLLLKMTVTGYCGIHENVSYVIIRNDWHVYQMNDRIGQEPLYYFDILPMN